MFFLVIALAVCVAAEGVLLLRAQGTISKLKRAHKDIVDSLKRRTEKVEREWNNFLTYNGDSQI